MSKLKQLIKSLLSDIMFVGCILGGFTVYLGSVFLGSCIFVSIIFKIPYWFGGVSISSDADTFTNFILTYGIATFIIGWIVFRPYQVCSK